MDGAARKSGRADREAINTREDGTMKTLTTNMMVVALVAMTALCSAQEKAAEIGLSGDAGPGLDSGTQTSKVACVTTRSGLVLDGADAHPLSGANVTFTGFVQGEDSDAWGDLYVSGEILIATRDGFEGKATVFFVAAGQVSEFGTGNARTETRSYRNMYAAAPQIVPTGRENSAINRFLVDAAIAGMGARLDLGAAKMEFSSLRVGPYSDEAPFEARCVAPGDGSMHIGVINAEGTVRNLFSFESLSYLPGSTVPMFQPDALTATILGFPAGAEPFHVGPDAHGTYAFSVPDGTLPWDFSATFVSVQIQGGFVTATSEPMFVGL